MKSIGYFWLNRQKLKHSGLVCLCEFPPEAYYYTPLVKTTFSMRIELLINEGGL